MPALCAVSQVRAPAGPVRSGRLMLQVSLVAVAVKVFPDGARCREPTGES